MTETAEPDRRAGGSVQQVAGPAVVAQALPEAQHLLFLGPGQVGGGRKRLEEALEVGDDRRDLGLLQHDLGEPDAIGVARALPRQVVPAVALLPGDEPRCQASGQRGP